MVGGGGPGVRGVGVEVIYCESAGRGERERRSFRRE